MQSSHWGKGFAVLGECEIVHVTLQERVVDTVDPATVNHAFDTSDSCDNDRRLP